jgi:predicted heme/steroid binding protein
MWSSRAIVCWLWLPIFLSILIGSYYYRHGTHPFVKIPDWSPSYQSPVILSQQELTAANGRNGATKSYLVVLGEIYDVTGSEHYKEGKGYSVFVGQDATTAFVTGKFTDQAADDVSSLETSKLPSVEKWVEFYRSHETYKFVGVLHGRYYNEQGHRTDAWKQARARMNEANKEQSKGEEYLKQFPACNSRWTQQEGSTIWCEDSMKQQRPSSSLVPRTVDLRTGMRCVCVELDQATAKPTEFKPYNNCEPTSQTCRIKPTS